MTSRNSSSSAPRLIMICAAVFTAAVIAALAPITARAAAGDLYESDSGSGTIFKFTPDGTKSTFASGLNSPSGLAFDASANLFVADYNSGTIFKFTPGGAKSTFASGLTKPTGIAFDSTGNLFVATYSGTISEFTPGGTKSTFASGLSFPAGLAFDAAGNLFGSDSSGRIFKFTPGGTKSTFASGLSDPLGLAFDGTGNLFEADYNTHTIFKFTPSGTKSTFASGVGSPDGLVFDATGNLFEVDNKGGTIFKFTPSGTKSTFASGLNFPRFLAFEPAQADLGLVAKVPLQTNAVDGGVTVNEALNKIYTSGGASTGQHVVVIDGKTFLTTDIRDVGVGSGASVDNKTNRYWAATVYDQSGNQENVVARDGAKDNVVATVVISNQPFVDCPTATTYDFFKNRVWVGTQCGAGNDAVFAIDAKTFNVIASPRIGSGGVMGSIIANGANGRLYLTTTNGAIVSKRVDPTTFAVTTNAFGPLMAINGLTNTLYAVSGNNLQIINGTPDPEVILATIPLSYTPGSVDINTALNYLYITNPTGNSIEVRDPSTGALIATFYLSPFGVTQPRAMTVDSTRGRIYVIASSGSGPVLLVIEDLINATSKVQCNGTRTH